LTFTFTSLADGVDPQSALRMIEPVVSDAEGHAIQ
jgi:hypothetical protein